MDFVTDILAMVEQILGFVNEPEAAGIIEIIKNSLADLFANISLPF